MTAPQSGKVAIPPNLVETLRRAELIAILTGAGISAEPAMPTILKRNGYTYCNAHHPWPLNYIDPRSNSPAPLLIWRGGLNINPHIAETIQYRPRRMI